MGQEQTECRDVSLLLVHQSCPFTYPGLFTVLPALKQTFQLFRADTPHRFGCPLGLFLKLFVQFPGFHPIQGLQAKVYRVPSKVAPSAHSRR
jgi:hypothetical protein